MASDPLFSVITVTFNAQDVLPATARSVVSQSLRHRTEWVVKDGGSTDETVACARAASADVLTVQTDSGIYDAMNQAIASARGEWLYFLNAGDAFADEHVLADVARHIEQSADAELVFGDVVYFGDRGERRRRFHWLTRRRLLFGDLCHQAAFMRRNLFQRQGVYDTSLRWNADFDWFLRAFRSGADLRYLPRDIARFHDAGSHVQAAERCAAERNAVRERYIPMPLWRLGNLALRVEHRLRRMAGQAI